jgi:chemotaxis protein CheD
MIEHRVLSINDLNVSDHPVVYTCYGLGSCIGLFITDRSRAVSGGAHIALAGTSDTGEYPNACEMIDQLLNGMREQGGDLSCLRAKVTGGAHVYDCSPDIGAFNTEIVLNYLVSHKIFIAATDVGGRFARTARFNCKTGELDITTSNLKMYSI